MPPDAPGGRTLDVFIQDEGVRRGVRVETDGKALRCGELALPLHTLRWTTRRAGLLLVFADEASLALRGDGSALDALSRGLRDRAREPGNAGSPPQTWRRAQLERFAPEGVVFTAGAAVAGAVDGDPVAGLCLLVCTRRALRLYSAEREWTVRWPVESATRTHPDGERAGADGGAAGETLTLRRGDTSLRIRYLRAEEISATMAEALRRPESTGTVADAGEAGDAVDRADAGKAGNARDAGNAENARHPGNGGALELFTREQVAPPTPAGLPEFSGAAGSLRRIAEEAARRVPDKLCDAAGMEKFALEMHFLELGEIALGPLLLRKSAASSARSLERAVQALEASELEEATSAAVATATDRLAAVYDRELERRLAPRAVPYRVEREMPFTEAERQTAAARMQAPFERIRPILRALGAEENKLLGRLEELNSGPPEGEGEAVEQAAAAWRATLARLDREFEKAWRDMARDVEETWSGLLLPRLARVAAFPPRRLPEWVQLAGLALVTVVAAALVVIYLF